MTDIGELLERVKAARGADMLLSNDMWRALRGQEPGSILYHETPDVTASIDAAIALVERVLPGWRWNIGHDANDELHATIWHGVTEQDEYGATAPLAILAALLLSLTKEPTNVQ